MPIPVLRHDRPPEGDEAAIFTYKPANEWDQQWVGIDVPTAQKVGAAILDALQRAQVLPWLPPGS